MQEVDAAPAGMSALLSSLHTHLALSTRRVVSQSRGLLAGGRGKITASDKNDTPTELALLHATVEEIRSGEGAG